MNKKELDTKFSFLLKQLSFTMLSVELLRFKPVQDCIDVLDSPGHKRLISSVGIEWRRFKRLLLCPARLASTLTDALLYAIKNVLGDAYEIVKDAADCANRRPSLKRDQAFFNFVRLLRNALKHNLKYEIKDPKKDLPALWRRRLPDGTQKTYMFDASWDGRQVTLGDFGNLRGALDLIEALREYAKSVLY